MKFKSFMKKFIPLITCLTILVGVCGFSITSYATSYPELQDYYEVDYVEPTLSTYGCYANILVVSENSSGIKSYRVDTLVFEFGNYAVSNDSICTVDLVISADKFRARPYKADTSNFNVMRLGANGTFTVLRTGVSEDPIDVSYYGQTILGFKLFGSYGVVSNTLSYNQPFNVLYSGNVDNYELQSLIYMIWSNSDFSAERLNEILGSSMTVEMKLDELKELYQESLSWYERLFNLIKDMFDNSQDEELDDLTQDNDKVVEGTDKENEVIDSTTEREEENAYSEQDIEDLKEQGQIDSGGTWGVFDAICRVNPKVFSVILTVLSIAIIGLIFNR